MSDETKSKAKPKPKPKLNVVLCWHMHQPEYRDFSTGEYRLPWVYLHAIKDYVDMAAHIENVDGARAVVNFAPVLLDQFEDYEQQLNAYVEGGEPLRDPMLAALAAEQIPLDPTHRYQLIHDCLRAHEERLVARFPAYQRLAVFAQNLQEEQDAVDYLSEQYTIDLLVWHHLAWMGETVRRGDHRVSTLIKKERNFSLDDRRVLIQVIRDLVVSIVPRYRVLAESGKIELATSPYAHPILPLLLDLQSAREAMPDATLPEAVEYPNGRRRALWHIEKGLETFRRHFGLTPRGCWPSEGSVSESTLLMLSDAGFQWAASGETVLNNSLQLSGEHTPACQHRVYEPEGTGMACYFRDDGLSDSIGFNYADWHADDAVANLIHHLENIATACADVDDAIVSIIMDGENAWEHYPENGYYFLSALYTELVKHPQIQLTTFSEHLARHSARYPLKRLVAGSWVYGTFSTWIGDRDKNRAWDMLVDAKQVFDRVMEEDRLDPERQQQAEHQLALCEGSDWFWWFGDYNPSETVSDFERLFRMNLRNLYDLLDEAAPEYLDHVFAHGSGVPAVGGVMRRGQEGT
jgi:alpha-amylase/alpha-mannosidase (GH57 family)